MAVAFVRQATGSSSTALASQTVTLAQAPAAGNTLVALIAFGCTTSQAVVNSVSSTGATWTQAAQGTYDTNSNGQDRVEIWTGTGDTGTTITITFSDACKFAANVSEWSGLSTTVSVAGVTFPVNQTSSAGVSFSSPALTNSPAGDLAIAGLSCAKEKTLSNISGQSGSPTASVVLTNIASGATTAGNVMISPQYAIMASTGNEVFSWTDAATTGHLELSAVTLAQTTAPPSDPFPLAYAEGLDEQMQNAVYRM